MAVADASYLIGLQRHGAAAQRLQRRLEESGTPLRIPTMAWLELAWGLSPARRGDALAAYSATCSFLAFDMEIAVRAARVQDDAVSVGRRLDWPDLVVAATAASVGEPVVTLDGDFEGIPGLEVLRP